MVAWGESQAHRDRIAIRYDCPSRPQVPKSIVEVFGIGGLMLLPTLETA